MYFNYHWLHIQKKQHIIQGDRNWKTTVELIIA